jgi:hypothetical protein
MGTLSARRAPHALAWVALAILTSIGPPTAHAQAGVTSTRAFDSTPARDPAPQPATVACGLPAFGAESPPARTATGPLDVICESIFGAASKDQWRPLGLSTLFTEGWDAPYVNSPAGTNGAPKQNWFGAADGIFARQSSLGFFFTDGMTTNTGLLLSPFPWAPVKPQTNGNEYWASYNLYLPLNQRLELLVVVPFVASNTARPAGHHVANFGDLTISERLRLVEQRNLSVQALLTERTPTGQTVNGNDINYITPALECWWNFAPRWVLRGGTGINIDTGRTSATDTYFNNVAMGRYLTTRDAPIFREMVAHVAVSTTSDVLGRKGYITEVYVAPGLRFGLDRNDRWYALGAIQVPVAGPHPYAYQLNLGLSRNY